MSKNGEPSVEEILESIKNVMERDNRASFADASRRRRAEGDTSARTKSTLEDGHKEKGANGDEVLDLADLELTEDLDIQETSQNAEDLEMHGLNDQPLIGEETRGAMQENLAALAMLAQPGAKPQIVRSGETSLEGLTRELMRPMLAEWLDKNLPSMVETMVQAEIARIAGKRN